MAKSRLLERVKEYTFTDDFHFFGERSAREQRELERAKVAIRQDTADECSHCPHAKWNVEKHHRASDLMLITRVSARCGAARCVEDIPGMPEPFMPAYPETWIVAPTPTKEPRLEEPLPHDPYDTWVKEKRQVQAMMQDYRVHVASKDTPKTAQDEAW
ncbi:hypothetical protein N5B55_04780 [Ralstonia pickettii]|uniref:hypothetical protein n=1 Tax=Ralstonia pickettii TaxID=329 RepID=UPI002714817D|nr:hypothetical protein [Ralstonia pickettii]WKZ86268.1 hypothetical protein N5B55_04780 [Ralstonia pickettii]